MNNDTLLQGLSNIRKACTDLIDKMGETPPATPPTTPPPAADPHAAVVSYETHPEFIKLKEENERLKGETKNLSESNGKLEADKKLAARKDKLTELAKTRKLNIEDEMKEWGDTPDEVFAKHEKTIVASYASHSAGGAKVEPLDGSPKIQDAELMNRAQKITSARIRAGNDSMQFHQVMEHLRSNPSWDGSGNPL